MKETLAKLSTPDFDLALTLNCGQAFHWKQHGPGWLGMIGDSPCYAEQRGDTLLVPVGMEEIASRYFALDHPLEKIRASFPRDPRLNTASEHCRGLRILRQPRWECVASFITSTQKAVPHIAQISHTLRERFGQRTMWQDQPLHAYPTPAAIAALEERDLRACALGYRAKTFLGAARQIASGKCDLDALATLGDDALRDALCALPGVGVKVANCALLFTYERLGSVPIDVWIARILRESYLARRRNLTPAKMRDFAATHFGPYAGYAQQYLFHHARWEKANARSH